jgi:lipoprotein signal peptidase
MIIFIILLILDQFIKIIIVNNNFNFKVIDNLLSITYVKNSGIVFGFFQGSNGVMILYQL